MIQTGPIEPHTHIGEVDNHRWQRQPHCQRGRAGFRQSRRGARQHAPTLIRAKPASATTFAGDGYFGVDTSLSKSWKIREGSGLRFAWEVFNVTNSVRFDVNPLTSLQNMTSSGEFGAYGAHAH